MRTRSDKPPKPVSREWLMRAAAHYLERYASSSENLRRVLSRKVLKRTIARGEDAGDFSALIEEIVTRFEEFGFLDDEAYAEARTRSLRRKGLSERMVQAKLGQKGVAEEAVGKALEKDETTEAEAAIRYAKRRRLGPWRSRERAERRDKDIAAMMRAGFAYGLARDTIDGENAISSDEEPITHNADHT